jgi:homoserine kinase
MPGQPRQAQVRVPATSANLGPGFDCLGLALDLWNETLFLLDGEGLQITCSGEGQEFPLDERNLIAQAVRFYCDERGLRFPHGLRIHCQNSIPGGSGMGSSAAAALTGILGAAALLDPQRSALELTQGETARLLLTLAARLEGHADNAASALFGGLILVAGGKGSWLFRKVEIPTIQVAVALPTVRLTTHAARAALPQDVSLQDAVHNIGHTALVIEALRNGDLHLLHQAMDDRLHLPYRLPLIPGGLQAMDAAYAAGASAVTISGAGPSLIAFTAGSPAPAAQAMQAAFAALDVPARTFLLRTSQEGASVTCSESAQAR